MARRALLMIGRGRRTIYMYFNALGYDRVRSMPRFPLPLLPAEFELPTEWWEAGGLLTFKQSASAYRSAPGAAIVALREIEPPFRFPEHPKDWRGFDRERMVRILQGFANGAEIEPVPVVDVRGVEYPEPQFRYLICNGLHRFYASIAAGFTHLPVEIK